MTVRIDCWLYHALGILTVISAEKDKMITDAICKGCYSLGSACGSCERCYSELAKMKEDGLIELDLSGMEAHQAALAYYRKQYPVVHASRITPERCCYITGLLDMCKSLEVSNPETVVPIFARLGVTAEELTFECVGKSRGKP